VRKAFRPRAFTPTEGLLANGEMFGAELDLGTDQGCPRGEEGCGARLGNPRNIQAAGDIGREAAKVSATRSALRCCQS
jgi:hypothetical protein